MGQLDLISSPHTDKEQPHRLRAFLASCAFHGLLLGLILWLAFLYRSQIPPPKSGSAFGAPSISLEKMIIVSPQPKSVPLPSPSPALSAPAPVAISTPQPHEPETLPKPPEIGVPVLVSHPSKPAKIRFDKVAATVPAATVHRASAVPPVQPKAARSASSPSLALGREDMSNPPYPAEAIDRRETGTVFLNVQFNAQGSVLAAMVTQSSGVPVLDNEAKSFICAHWHSSAYAGQIVNVPVQYKLENL